MTTSDRAQRSLREALFGYVAFAGLSTASRLFQPLFLLVILTGLTFPLLWGRRTHDWPTLGFTRRNLGQGLLWGVGAGLIASAYVVWRASRNPYPPVSNLGLQLAAGVPLALLVVAPFQEFFFRAWLQPRLEAALGRWRGLLLTALSFSLWHLLAPFEGTATSSLQVSTLAGILTTLAMGLAFGYIFQRVRNIAAPWLAHALMVVATILVGAMTLVQYTP